MMEVLLSPKAQKQFDALPGAVKERMRTLFRRLARWPAVSGAKRLTGNLAGSYRMRTGDYRLLFQPRGDAIIVDTIGHRKDVYEG